MPRTTALVSLLVGLAAVGSAVASEGRALLGHEADDFRAEVHGGMHNALDPNLALDDQVTRTTCLPSDDFVRTKNNKFTLGGRDFVFAGWNQWEVLEAASDAPPPFRHLPLPGREHVVRLMNEAVENGLKVVRMWAHTITPGHAIQSAPGVWNEDILRGMDFVLAEARKRGLKIIWAVADNWYPVGGIDQYVEWSPTASRHRDFFTDDAAFELYEKTFETLANRVNSITGVAYKDDPTIMAWNLANEARCQGCDSRVMQSWIERMCASFKARDPNHLVGIGYEGFYGPDSGKVDRNPGKGGSTWASREGQDFIANNRASCVDYVGIHVWPDDWNFEGVDFQKAFIREHVEDARRDVPGKPFVLEEFGKIVDKNDPDENRRNDAGGRVTETRDAYFRAAYEVAEAAAQAGDLAGTLFWHWYDRGVGPGRYGVRSNDSTFPIIQKHVRRMNDIAGEKTSCDA